MQDLFFKHLINFFSQRNLVKATAFSLFLYVFLRNTNRKGITVLCLTRRSNEYDIKALKQFETRFNFIDIPFNTLKLAQRWLPKLEQTFYKEEIKGYPKAFTKSKRLAEIFLKLMKKGGYNLKFVLSANFDYYEDFLFKDHPNVAYIALSREHYVIPVSYDRGLKRYTNNYKFNGKKILVYGSQTRKLLEETNVASGKVKVVGCPRFDFFLENKFQTKSKKYVTLFSFIDGLYYGNQTFDEVLDEFVLLAKKHPSIPFLIKCKSLTDYEILEKNVKGVKNINLSYSIDYLFVFENSKIIISFNSNSLLEGLLAGAKTIIPFWSDTKKDPYQLLIDPNSKNGKFFNFTYSRGEFSLFLEKSILENYQAENWEERKKVLSYYFYLPERNSSNLVGDEMKFILENEL